MSYKIDSFQGWMEEVKESMTNLQDNHTQSVPNTRSYAYHIPIEYFVDKGGDNEEEEDQGSIQGVEKFAQESGMWKML